MWVQLVERSRGGVGYRGISTVFQAIIGTVTGSPQGMIAHMPTLHTFTNTQTTKCQGQAGEREEE